MSDAIIAVDGHVHVHPSVNVDVLLSAAHANLAAVAKARTNGAWQGVLMLAEMKQARWFDAVLDTGASESSQWSLELSPHDDTTLHARSDAGELAIVAGRQVVTSEGIEVLTLATRTVVGDGMPLQKTLESAHQASALTVLPWGVGKWLGRRGRLVSDALRAGTRQLARGPVFAGDNGGRPWFWPAPTAFSSSTRSGMALLPGTDPLPLPREEQRVGSFGFWFSSGTAVTGRAIRDHLARARPEDVHPFGQLQGAVKFLHNQTALRLHK